jgi:hypothetical protein
MMNGAKRKSVLTRKPSVVIALGMPKPTAMASPDREKEMPEEEEMAEDGLQCPRCGAELVDTPENREYAKSRAAEAEEESEDEDVVEDAMDEDDAYEDEA